MLALAFPSHNFEEPPQTMRLTHRSRLHRSCIYLDQPVPSRFQYIIGEGSIGERLALVAIPLLFQLHLLGKWFRKARESTCPFFSPTYLQLTPER
jgi:hypothetical protein